MDTATPVTKFAARPNLSRTPLTRWLLPRLETTVGSKLIVALTGLALTAFVYVHMAGNLLVFSGPDALNDYAKFLKDHPLMLWTARIGLLTVFVLHVGLALRLQKRSRDARPVRYVREATVQASWASRHMALTGLLLLAFIIFHLLHYTFGAVQSGVSATGQRMNFLALHDSKGRHDVYAMVINGFRDPTIVLAYVVAQIVLAIHLLHGIASAFQTLGLSSPRWWPLIRSVGMALAVIVAAGNILMPVAVYLGWIGAGYIR